jgi:protein-disulfide isomerase
MIILACIVYGADQSEELARLREQVAALQQSQERISATLNEIKAILMAKPSPLENAFITLAGHPSLGDSNAPVTLVEFSDYQCFFCGQYRRETFPHILDTYIKTAKVRYVVRNFPLHSHPFAAKAAEAAYCAGEQGKFWEAHDRFFANQTQLSLGQLSLHASALGLDTNSFDSCMQTNRYAASVERDINEGRQAGVAATPTFFIGYIDAGGGPSRLHAVKQLIGAVPFPRFQTAIDSLLTDTTRVPAHERP